MDEFHTPPSNMRGQQPQVKPDGGVYSTTIDRSRQGKGFVNILAHDPMLPGEEANSPAMEPYKYFKTNEQASNYAADRAEAEYDQQRKDPNSQWYMGTGQ